MINNLKERFKAFVKTKSINLKEETINKMFDSYAEQ